MSLQSKKHELGKTVNNVELVLRFVQEMQFVFDAQVKNFTEHWGDGNTPEADLIRKIKPKVEVLYITTNYDKKSKITIMVKDMKKAFYTEGGLQRLINSITTSLQNGLEKMEFKMTKNSPVRFRIKPHRGIAVYMDVSRCSYRRAWRCH